MLFYSLCWLIQDPLQVFRNFVASIWVWPPPRIPVANEGLYETPMILVTGILGGGKEPPPSYHAVCSRPLQHQVEAQGKKIHHKSSWWAWPAKCTCGRAVVKRWHLNHFCCLPSTWRYSSGSRIRSNSWAIVARDNQDTLRRQANTGLTDTHSMGEKNLGLQCEGISWCWEETRFQSCLHVTFEMLLLLHCKRLPKEISDICMLFWKL